MKTIPYWLPVNSCRTIFSHSINLETYYDILIILLLQNIAPPLSFAASVFAKKHHPTCETPPSTSGSHELVSGRQSPRWGWRREDHLPFQTSFIKIQVGNFQLNTSPFRQVSHSKLMSMESAVRAFPTSSTDPSTVSKNDNFGSNSKRPDWMVPIQRWWICPRWGP